MKCGLTAVDLAVTDHDAATEVRIYATLCIPHLCTMQMISAEGMVCRQADGYIQS